MILQKILSLNGSINIWSREALLKGKAQYRWPPCTNQFRLVTIPIDNLIFLKNSGLYYIRVTIVIDAPSGVS